MHTLVDVILLKSRTEVLQVRGCYSNMKMRLLYLSGAGSCNLEEISIKLCTLRCRSGYMH